MSVRRKQPVGKRSATHHVLVLLSGGIDSSACVGFYRAQKMAVEALFVNYGQPGAKQERVAALAISRHYQIKIHEAAVRGVAVVRAGFVPGRNALLVATALSCVAPESGLIALGIHAGVPYVDCRPGFLTACQALADVYHGGAVRIAAPFVEWSKADIVTAARDLKVPLQRTYSCEAGGAMACGVCLSCLDRARMLP